MNPAIPAVSACDSNPCQNGARCSGEANGFTCDCPSNFEGVLCENRRGKINILTHVMRIREITGGKECKLIEKSLCLTCLFTNRDNFIGI